MRKYLKVERYIRNALDCGYGIISVVANAEATFNVRVQPRAIPAGYEVSVYYLRDGNVTSRAHVFCCDSEGCLLPDNVVNLPVKRESRLWAWLYNFLEQCT